MQYRQYYELGHHSTGSTVNWDTTVQTVLSMGECMQKKVSSGIKCTNSLHITPIRCHSMAQHSTAQHCNPWPGLPPCTAHHTKQTA